MGSVQPAISAGKPLGAENSDYAVPQAYVNLAAAIVSTNGGPLKPGDEQAEAVAELMHAPAGLNGPQMTPAC